MRDSILRWITVFISLLSILSLVISFLYSNVLGFTLLIVICLALAFIFNGMNKLSEDRDNYISNLSYRIHRGEQETLLEMPVGVLMLSKAGNIEWVNPYLQPYFGDADLLGNPVSAVSPELSEILDKYWEDENPQVIEWKNHYFNLLIQKEYNTIYMMDITRYFNIEKNYNDEKK